MEKEAQRVVQLMYALFDVGDRAHDVPVVGFALHHCGLVDHGSLLHELHRLHLIFPYLGSAFGECKLLMEQHESIIGIRHAADNLRVYRLTVVFHLLDCHLGSAFAIEDLAESVDLPG